MFEQYVPEDELTDLINRINIKGTPVLDDHDWAIILEALEFYKQDIYI